MYMTGSGRARARASTLRRPPVCPWRRRKSSSRGRNLRPRSSSEGEEGGTERRRRVCGVTHRERLLLCQRSLPIFNMCTVTCSCVQFALCILLAHLLPPRLGPTLALPKRIGGGNNNGSELAVISQSPLRSFHKVCPAICWDFYPLPLIRSCLI